MNLPSPTRRDLLKTAALGVLTLPLAASLRAAEKKKAAPEAAALPTYASFPEGRENGLRLGVASYSLRNLPLDEFIATVKVMRISNVALFRLHCNWETAPADECRGVGGKLQAAGLRLTGSGVVNLPNDEAKCRRAFENVKAAGMATMVCKPDREALPLVAKLAREFDQKLAIHNHGPEDKVYPTPGVAYEAIKSLDSRVGLCIDVGHSVRGGEDAVTAIRKYASRVYDLHMKDSVAVPGAMKDIPIEVGAGRLDIRGVLRALLEIKYDGVVSFEYEKIAGNPVTGLAESIGYVRGVLAALAKA
ncbi:MAG: sugar phosphate isomerase/epimerase [Verrucomicrobia bacterium]|nr:sugar phosphate isomerase/epimerase [Verrucomicrobiota bacterium]